MVRVEELANGLKVVLVPCEAESVAFGLFVASGSRHEDGKVAGISHFIEHMLFKGTRSRTPLQISRAIEGRGGNFNACTSEEATVYYAHMPSEYLVEAVDILSDMYLNAAIAEDEFLREKQVVLEEIRMYADEPDSVAAENLQRALFPASRLGAPVAGSAATLEPLTPAAMRRYLRAHYRFGNTVAAVAGNFDCDEALAVVRERLRGRSRAGRFEAAADDPFAAAPVPETCVTKDVQQTQLAIGYRTFGIDDSRRYAAVVFDAIMGRGMSSRLFQELREKRGISYDIASRQQFFSDAGMWAVAAGVDPAKADRALATIDREIARIRAHRVPARELARVKEFLTGNFRMSHEKVTSKMFFYGQTLLSFGHLITPAEQIEGIASVTADDVLAFANEFMRPEVRAISRVTPQK